MILYERCLHICSWYEQYPKTEEPKNENELFKNDIIKDAPLTTFITELTTNVYIHDCLFIDCTSTTTGGVIAFSKETGKLLIEFSYFIECHSDDKGGAIYASRCDCIINKICSYKCISDISGDFLRAELAVNKHNYVIDSSICSAYDVTGKWCPVFLDNGLQKCDSVNISNYNVSNLSAFQYYSSQSTSQTKYCSIVSNHAVYYYCVVLDYGGYSYRLESCNIINNSQELDVEGTIVCREDTEITHCCIKENKSKYVFFIEPDVKATLEKTYVIPEDELNFPDRGIIIGNSVQASFINTLEHINCLQFIHKCHCSIHVSKCSSFVRICRFLSLAAIYSRTKSE